MPEESHRPATPPARDPFAGPGGPDHPPTVPPSAALVYGTSRPLVSLLLYAISEEANPRFHWLDIRRESEPPAEWDPASMGWLKDRHTWVADPSEGLSPDNARANAAIFHVVRSDEPPAVLAHLTDFLRLPPTIQEILGTMPAEGSSNLLAVANVDRISGAIPESALAPILAAFDWLRCSLYVGYVGARAPATAAFDHVIRIDGTGPDRWEEARVHFERGGSYGVPPSTDGVPAGKLPFLERTFQRALT